MYLSPILSKPKKPKIVNYDPVAAGHLLFQSTVVSKTFSNDGSPQQEISSRSWKLF